MVSSWHSLLISFYCQVDSERTAVDSESAVTVLFYICACAKTTRFKSSFFCSHKLVLHEQKNKNICSANVDIMNLLRSMDAFSTTRGEDSSMFAAGEAVRSDGSFQEALQHCSFCALCVCVWAVSWDSVKYTEPSISIGMTRTNGSYSFGWLSESLRIKFLSQLCGHRVAFICFLVQWRKCRRV